MSRHFSTLTAATSHHSEPSNARSSTFEPLMRFDSLCSANDCEIFWTKKGCESKCFLLPFLAMDAKCYFNSLSSATHSSCTLALWHTGPYCHIAPSRHMPQVKWCRSTCTCLVKAFIRPCHILSSTVIIKSRIARD